MRAQLIGRSVDDGPHPSFPSSLRKIVALPFFYSFVEKPNHLTMSMIAAQTLRRTAATATYKNAIPSMSSSFGGSLDRRWKSTDAGDVIGIDLGTTNSCVAIMVRVFSTLSYM
jgi:hypothetical protein